MKQALTLSLCAIAVSLALAEARAQTAKELDSVVVVGKRDARISKGATGLSLEILDTPQSISTLEKEDIRNFSATGVNDALRLATGLNLEQYETNRASFNSRGFDVQLTQIDGLGMSNDWGTVVGQQDTYLFERIELIRGANGLLTGVGNASGTINYIRKRPLNRDTGEVGLLFGSNARKRGVFDYNKVLSEDARWAGRLVVAHEDKDAHIRDLHERRTSVYGVVDGQIGENGMLTLGVDWQRSDQDSPMWGSLTLNYLPPRSGQAEFDTSASTAQDWTFWNTRTRNAFVEYSHDLNENWVFKITANHRRVQEQSALLYAYAPAGGLNADNTGLVAWPYAGRGETRNRLLDVHLRGQLEAGGRQHEVIAGLSHSVQTNQTHNRTFDESLYMLKPLPAFPYAGDVFAEPLWGDYTPRNNGEQKLTRFYAAGRFALADSVHAIAGINAVKLQREGGSRYGAAVTVTEYPDTEKASPYVGLTWEFAPNVVAYASWSDIFKNQDESDMDGVFLAPMRGINKEVGLKAEWMDGRMLTSAALFSAQQKGIATFGGVSSAGRYYYVPKDVESRGVEIENTGRIGEHLRLSLGITHLKLTGPDRMPIYEWVPRNSIKLRVDGTIPGMPTLQAGAALRWQSDVMKQGGARQGDYLLASVFAGWDISPRSRLQLNIDNVFNKKYLEGLAYGALYGAPRSFALSYHYSL